jgi:hypothetical protein
LTSADWTVIGRFVAGLLAPDGCELARADCAPRDCGNGSLTSADWTVAGRYVAGLFTPVSLSGCGGSGLAPLAPAPGPKGAAGTGSGGTARVLWMEPMAIVPGESNCLSVRLEAQGDENAIGFSLGFEPEALEFVSARLGGTNGLSAQAVNTNGLGIGRLGFFLGLGQDQGWPAGAQVLAEVCFRARPAAPVGPTAITVLSDPVVLEVNDPLGEVLALEAREGVVQVVTNCVFAPLAVRRESGTRLVLVGPPGGVWEVQGSPDLVEWDRITELTNVTGFMECRDAQGTNAPQRFYRAVRR